jgi:Uma2 family endonuclease
MRMVSAGVLDEDDHVELIKGELFVVSPQDPAHASAVGRTSRRLFQAYGAGYQVRVQLPLRASQHDLPEPDIAVVRGSEESFDRRHPEGHEAVLVIEVTSTSRRGDRRKAAIYAAAKVPTYWRLDVVQRRLEVYAGAPMQLFDESAEVALPHLPGRSVKVSELLPSPER